MHSEGPRVTEWMARAIVQTKGRWYGQPLAVESWQRDFVDELYTLGPDGRRLYQEALLMIPRKNGKSTLASGLGLYMLCADGEAAPEVYVAAGSRDQASVVFKQAKDTVNLSPLRDYLRPMQYHIEYPRAMGVFRVIASDAKLQHGSNPSASIVDELWAHRTLDLYSALTTGTGAREEPLTVTITTAGDDIEGPLGQLYTRALSLDNIERRNDGFLTIARDPDNGFLAWIYAPPHDEAMQYTVDLEDPEVWKAVNPASWITGEYLRRQHDKPSTRLEDFQRFHLNVWTEGDEPWLPPGAWRECAEDGLAIEPGARVWAAVDLGLKKDTAAITVVGEEREDGRVPVDAMILEPPGNGQPLDIGLVEEAIRETARTYQLMECAYDPWSMERSAQLLLDQGIPMVEFPMSNERMAPASKDLRDGIVSGRLVHSGDPRFAAHVGAGMTTETERGWRLTKRKATKPIDALIALVMAYSRFRQGAGTSVYEDRGILTLG